MLEKSFQEFDSQPRKQQDNKGGICRQDAQPLPAGQIHQHSCNTAATTATDDITMEMQVDEHDVMDNSDDVNPENTNRSMKGDRMRTFI